MATPKVKKVKTVVGLVTLLEVSGAWLDEYGDLARERGCNGVQWYMDAESGRSCDPLRPLADLLTFLRIRSSRPVDDSALTEMRELKFLDATTRARNDLDLRVVDRLSLLMIDDRKTLALPDGHALKTVELYRSTRDLDYFEQAAGIKQLQLENKSTTVMDCRAELRELERLRVVKGVVTSLSGMVAPDLRFLSFDRVGGGELDLADLSGCPRLRQVSLNPREPLTVRNAGGMSGDLIANELVTIA